MEDQSSYKIGRALIIAPLMIPIFIVILTLILGGKIDDFGFIVVFVITVVCYLTTLFIGLPAFYLLNRLNSLNLITLASSGALLGAIIGMFLYIFDELFLQLLLGAVCGFVISLVFGLVAGVKVLSGGVKPERKY